MSAHASVEDYLADQPEATRAVLEEVRRRVRAAVPEGEDAIRYDMPTVLLDGASLLHYAGWKRHVSLYPEPDGDPALSAELAPYSSGRGTLKFPLASPVPWDLVDRVVARLLAQRRAG